MFKGKKYWKEVWKEQQELLNIYSEIIDQDIQKINELRRTINILSANKIKLMAKISKLESKIKELENGKE